MARTKKKQSKATLGILAALIVAAVAGAFIWNNSRTGTDHDTMDHASIQESSATAPESTIEASDAQEVTIDVEAGNFYFNPKEIAVKKGTRVTINLTAKGMRHDFVLDEFDFEIPVTGPGQTSKGTFTADKAGTFEYYCSIGSHRQRGQVGKLIVTE